ncbi:hypothetical protein BH10CHL1_BH10CHL1_02490 [soil metagenome]
MSQYQKHIRNATFYRINLVALYGLLLVVLIGSPAQAKSLYRLQPSRVAQTAAAQVSASDFRLLVLLPVESTTVALQTHTTEFRLNYENEALTLNVAALYRIKNAGNSLIIVPLKVTPIQADAPSALPDTIDLLAGAQPLSLTAAGQAGYTTQVQIAPGSTIDVNLNYTVAMGNTPLPTINYPFDWLNQWPLDPQNGVSLRISILPAAAISPDSWLPATPADWRYTQPADGTQLGIKWLYDIQVPEQPITFRMIHPARWQALQTAQQAATPGAAPAAFMQLGELMRQFYVDIPAASADSLIRERFYAQALAAYSAGLENAGSTGAPQDLAALHAGLATLYRNRSIDAAGKVDLEYVALMVQEAELALQILPANGDQATNDRRRELVQWQSEGLTAQLNAARQQRAWGDALRIVDQLAALPADISSGESLTETRRSITVQQALEFLEQNNQAAAVALAGDEIGDPTLLPPSEARALFAHWHMTTTIALKETRIEVTALPLPDRREQAYKAVQTLANLWQMSETSGQASTFALEEASATADATEPLHLVITLPAATTIAATAQKIPPDANWALFRTLLLQIAPQIDQESYWLRQRTDLSQPLDLRTAGDQWDAMASNLDREATQFEQQSAAMNAADSTKAENALRLRIQSANYRNASQEWRNLTHNSWVMTTLAAPAGLQTISRSWLISATTPAQRLTLQSEALNAGRLIALLVGALIGLFLLAGTLWWLL